MSNDAETIEIQTGVWNDGVIKPGQASLGDKLGRITLDDVLAKQIGLTIERLKRGMDAAGTTATRIEIEFGVTIEGEGKILVVSTKAGAALTVKASWGP